MLSPSPVSVVSDPGSPAVVSVDEVAEVREVVRRARRESVDVLVYLVEKGVGIMRWNMCGIKTSEWEGGRTGRDKFIIRLLPLVAQGKRLQEIGFPRECTGERGG